MNPFHHVLLLTALLPAAALHAQEPVLEPASPTRSAPSTPPAASAEPDAHAEARTGKPRGKGATLLAQAIDATANAGSLAFKTVQKNPSPIRAAGIAVGGDDGIQVEGSCVPGLQTVRHGKHELVLTGPLMIAREGDEPWKLRQGHLANGAQLPFVLRPDLLLHVLRHAPLEVVHTEVGTDENMPVEIVTVTLENDAAWDLVYAGALPRPGTGMHGMIVRMAVGGAGPVAPQEPELTLDLAFVIDPPSKFLRAIRCRAYTKGGAMGGAMVFVAGPGGGIAPAPAEEEEHADDAEGAGKGPSFKDGLPVRKKAKDESVSRFDVRFTDHGKVAAPQLDAHAKQMLGL